MKRVIAIITVIFLILFIYLSVKTMITVPLHDYDEANRAEAAKNMDRYKFYLTPLTGGPFFIIESLKITAKNNPLLNLYFNLERPPLFFWSMIGSTKVIGDSEFAYRLPSFIAGLLGILIILYISFKYLYIYSFIAFVPPILFLLSKDWWLSSQSAMMDTMLSIFLFSSFIFLVSFVEKKNFLKIFLAGLFLGMSVMSKGQPTIIMVFPLVYLLIAKKISFVDLLIFIFASLIPVLPWIIFTVNKFGLNNFAYTFLDFSVRRTIIKDPTQIAPVYWYTRWWMESFRQGFILFITLFVNDFLLKRLDWKKILVFQYWLISFIFFSISKNKVWWYVLPLIPVALYYIIISLQKFKSDKSLNIFLIIAVASLPFFYKTSNTIALLYLVLLLFVSQLILKIKFKLNVVLVNISILLITVGVLMTGYLNFPVIIPTFKETKIIGEDYKKLSQPKCLYVQNMPYEAALFYSDSEEIDYLENSKLNPSCNNYLLTPNKEELPQIAMVGRLKLYRLK